MYRSGTILATYEQLKTAMLHKLHVVVYQDGQLIGFGGQILEFDHIAVKINGSWYMLKNCEFRIR